MAPPKSKKRNGHNNAARRRWLVAGLAAFVLFDIVLVAFALKGEYLMP
jgi:hypothetical protein